MNMTFDLQRFASYSNYDYYTEFNGSSSDDTMYNHASNVIINAGAGNDYIENYGSNTVTINGGAGDDTISRLGSNNVIAYANGDGNDSVAYSAYTSTVNIKITDGSSYTTSPGALSSTIVQIGSGSITIERGQTQTISIDGGTNNSAPNTTGRSYSNYDYYTEFNGGLGDDTMYNHASNVQINAGDGNDYIDNAGNNTVTINGGAGDDTISRLGSNNVIAYANGDGNDSVAYSAYTNTVNIKITDGSSYTTSPGALSSTIVQIGSGSITIERGQTQTISIDGGTNNSAPNTTGRSYSNYDYYTEFNGGLGDDTMYNHASNVQINAGDGNDYIDNAGNNTVTINGGAGDDTIARLGASNVIEYAEGDGNDSVAYSAYTNSVHIKITDGSSYTTSPGALSSTIVQIGSGSITIERGQTQDVSIEGGVNNNPPDTVGRSYSNYDYYTEFNGGLGDDTMYNHASNVQINAGDGNDYIDNYGNNTVTINGGAGDDTIARLGASNVIEYAEGDGNDSVAYSAYTNTVNINLTDGSNYSTVEGSLSSMVVQIGSGSITIERGMTQEVNITGGTNTGSGGSTSSVPYGLTKSGSTLYVTGDYSEAGVWLNGFNMFTGDAAYSDDSIVDIDASSDNYYDASSARLLVGNNNSNVIRAGYDRTWMWGGLGGDDTMYGGNGADMFWFGGGGGSDVVENCGNEDVVYLFSFDLNTLLNGVLTDFRFENHQIGLGFNDGGRLDIHASGDSTTVQLSDGSHVAFDHNNNTLNYTEA